MDGNEDRRIVAELKKNRQFGESLLASKYHAFLMETAIRLYGIARSDAGDVVNRVFWNFLSSFDRFKFIREGDIKAWMETCLKNRAIDHFRSLKSRTKKGEFLFDPAELDRPDDKDEISNVAIEVINKLYRDFESTGTLKDERIAEVEDVIGKFSVKDQDLLWAYIYNLPHKELMITYGSTSVDATRQYVHRLFDKFIKLIAQRLNKDWRKIKDDWKRKTPGDSTNDDLEQQAQGS